MPEGPSIFILKELITPLLKGRKIVKAFGNARIDLNQLAGKKVTDIRCWGKQLLIYTNESIIRVHLLMFGSYSIDENTKPARSLRLALTELFIVGDQARSFYGKTEIIRAYGVPVLQRF